MTSQTTTSSPAKAGSGSPELPLLFTPIMVKGVTFRNRFVIPPTSLFTCDQFDGKAGSFHLQHLGSRAIGGAGLVLTEAAAVSPEGRTSADDLGFWSDEHAEAFAPTVEFVQKRGCKIGVQLFHGGRRTSLNRPLNRPLTPEEGGWVPMGPSAIRAGDRYPEPREMDHNDIDRMVKCYGEAARRADQYGWDVVDLHSCHGYLLHQFLSPRTNFRKDEYGGVWENRVRFSLRAAESVRKNWPESKPLFVRLSATEWIPDGWQFEEMLKLSEALVNLGVDVIDVSGGGGVQYEVDPPFAPGYMTHFAEEVRKTLNVPTCAVGLITTAALAEETLQKGQADFICVSRAFLRDPYFGIRCAEELGCPEAMPWPPEYASGVAALKRFGL